MTELEIRDQIYAVVCSICERHYPLCEAQPVKVRPTGTSSEMKILFNHGLQDVQVPVVVPVITVEVLNLVAGDIGKATITLSTQGQVSNINIDKPPHLPSLAYLSHFQVHVMEQVTTVNLMNFGMMLDHWLNVVGYMLNDAWMAINSGLGKQ